MKHALLLLLALYMATACSPGEKKHLPSEAARFLIEVKVIPVAGIPADQALNDMAKFAVDRLETAGITYQAVETDETTNTIRFRLIDGPPAQAGERVHYDAAYFQNAIIPKAKLEFWDIYQVNDPGLSAPFQQFYEEQFLFKYLEFNVQGQSGPTVFGIADLADVPVIDSFLALPEKKALFPPDLKFGWAKARMVGGKLELFALKTYNRPAPLTGRDLKDAYVFVDGQPGQVMVGLDFKAGAAVIWEEMTRKASEDNHRGIAIVLNDKILSVPLVMSPIPGGKSSITGDFTLEEAQDLALQLKMSTAGHQMTVLKAVAL
ncbi:MAG: hypothetical protein SH848_14640 [Saprospiraceae bacterium]|nr:hypothetical protein [Saprospiraceae bacterium]MDZ4705167.1 hypothetical protein [Saprospiraceae bacterium]